MKSDKENASSVRPTAKSKCHPRQPITLSMIALELENDLTEIRSHFARIITKVCSIMGMGK